MDAADHSEAGEDFRDVAGPAARAPPADRSHNRETLSSEAMTEMLRDIQDTMLALDARLAALGSAQGQATHDTSRLARGVVDLGDALARRVRALEHGRPESPPILGRLEMAVPIKPARPRPQHRLTWTAALIFILIVVLGAFWLLNAESADHASMAAAPKPVVMAPAPAPAVEATTPVVAPMPIHTPSHTVTAHRAASQASPSAPSHPASSSAPPPIGFGHYGPAPSNAPPGPAKP